MPLIEVSVVAGRSPRQLRELITRLTDATEEAIGAPRQSIRVILREVPASHWAAGDVTIEERRRPPTTEDTPDTDHPKHAQRPESAGHTDQAVQEQ